jgi:hypothetical protein
MPGGQPAAGAVGDRETRPGDLRGRRAAELSGGLDQQEDAAHAGVGRRQPASVGVQRRSTRLVEAQPTPVSERAALALGAEAQVFQGDDHGDGERVVNHRDVDLAGPLAGLAERLAAGVDRGRDRDVVVVVEVPRRLARSRDPHRWVRPVGGEVRRDDNDCAAAVVDQAAVKKVQRIGDHRRGEHHLGREFGGLDAQRRQAASCSAVVPYLAMCRLAQIA